MGIDDITYFPAEGPRPPDVDRIFRVQQERNELAGKMGELIEWFDLLDEFATMQGRPELARAEIQDDIRRVQAILRGES